MCHPFSCFLFPSVSLYLLLSCISMPKPKILFQLHWWCTATWLCKLLWAMYSCNEATSTKQKTQNVYKSNTVDEQQGEQKKATFSDTVNAVAILVFLFLDPISRPLDVVSICCLLFSSISCVDEKYPYPPKVWCLSRFSLLFQLLLSFVYVLSWHFIKINQEKSMAMQTMQTIPRMGREIERTTTKKTTNMEKSDSGKCYTKTNRIPTCFAALNYCQWLTFRWFSICLVLVLANPLPSDNKHTAEIHGIPHGFTNSKIRMIWIVKFQKKKLYI